MHAALALRVGVDRRAQTFTRAHSEVFAVRGPWRAAQGPVCEEQVSCSSYHPSLERNYGRNGAFFLLHFSLHRDSV